MLICSMHKIVPGYSMIIGACMGDCSLLTYSLFYADMLIYCGRYQMVAREFP